MRRYLIASALFLGISTLTLVVWGQESNPYRNEANAPVIVAEAPAQRIEGVWQPIELEAVESLPYPMAGASTLNGGQDSCAAAATLLLPGGSSVDVTQHTEDDVEDPVLSCMWGSPPRPKGYRTTWYKFTAPINGQVTIHTLGSNYDTVVSIYSGSCGGLVPLSCSDDFEGFNAQVSLTVAKGDTYYVEVADWQEEPPPGGASLSISALLEPLDSKWQQVGLMPLPRSRHATVVVGNDVYVIGGQSGSLGAPVVEKRLERYETDTGNWVRLADKPGTSGYSNTTAAYVDGPNDSGRIYLPAGYTGNDTTFGGTHWVYDIAANYWLTATSAPWPGGVPYAWSSAVASPAENGYYLMGGLGSQPPFVSSAQVYSQTLFYSAATDSWSVKPSMNAARYGHTGALVNGRVCVTGGLGVGQSGGQPVTILHQQGECFNGTTWQLTGTMSKARYAAGSAVGPGGKWYVFGGVDALGNAVATVEVYNPASNSWTPLPLAFELGGGTNWPARAWPQGGFVGSTLWSVGGNNMPASQALPMVDSLFASSYDAILPAIMSAFDSRLAPDATFERARPLALNQPVQQNFDDLLDFYDVYRFELSGLTPVTVTLTNIPSGNDLNIAVYSANKLLWGSSNNSGNLSEKVALTLNTGTYYVMVQRVSGLPQPNKYYLLTVAD